MPFRIEHRPSPKPSRSSLFAKAIPQIEGMRVIDERGVQWWMSRTNPDDLSDKLRAWQIAPRVPGSFQRDVWRRIALRQAARDTTWRRALRGLAREFSRPAPAFAVVALSMALSIGLAHWRAADSNALSWRKLEARYAASINPLAHSASFHE